MNSILKKISNGIVKGRHILLLCFIVFLVASLFLMKSVVVNYDITKYLPDSSTTKAGIEIMQKEFGDNGTASVLVKNISKREANAMVSMIANIEGVDTVLFDDNSQNYYKDNTALMQVFLSIEVYSDKNAEILNNIKIVLDEYDYALCGNAVDALASKAGIIDDMPKIFGIALIIIFLILLLTSKSWLEPILFLVVTGVALVINLGTNAIFSNISFVTNAICALLQLALSMDYSIVLLSRFNEEKNHGLNKFDAMKSALTNCLSPISASGLTTIAGLTALCFMQFSIGLDLGLVLMKGILMSFICVFCLFPSLLLIFSKLLEKTQIKSIRFKMDKFVGFAKKHKRSIPLIALCLIVTCGVVQSFMNLSYSVESSKSGSEIKLQQEEIETTFGKQNSVVVLVPIGEYEKQKALVAYLDNYTTSEKEKAFDSISSIAKTGLYDTYTPKRIQNEYGLNESQCEQIFTLANKNAQTQILYGIELINTISTYNIISNVYNSLQNDFNTLYTSAYSQFSLSTVMQAYNINQVQATQLFMSIKGRPINENDTVFGYELINALFSLKDSLNLNENMESMIVSNYYNLYKKWGFNELATALKFNPFDINLIKERSSLDIEQQFVYNYELSNEFKNGYLANVGESLESNVDVLVMQSKIASKMFEGTEYARIICNLKTGAQDDISIAVIKDLEKKLPLFYQDDENQVVFAGATVSVVDMQETFSNDVIIINIISILAVMLIVMATFRSLFTPILLIAVIQGAILINMAFNTIIGNSVFFIGYLIAICIQMGATIDYAIITTDRYVNFRKSQNKIDSMTSALNSSMPTIFTSGLILIVASLIIAIISSSPLISSIGLIISIGSIFSCLLVIFLLPSLLFLCDRLVEKTTKNSNFKK